MHCLKRLMSMHASTLTAPVLDVPSTGLPEEPSIDEGELRHHADVFAGQLRQRPRRKTEEAVSKYLERLRSRLTERLPVWQEGTSAGKAILTPKLELVESARMLEAAIPRGDDAANMFADVPVADLPPEGPLPEVIHLAGSYLLAVDGIWSGSSLSTYVDQVQKHQPLMLREIQLLPDALKLAQLEFILNRADETLAAGELPPIEQSPFSAPIHSLRRMNQIQWRDVLEPLVAFDAVLRQDPSGGLRVDGGGDAQRI